MTGSTGNVIRRESTLPRIIATPREKSEEPPLENNDIITITPNQQKSSEKTTRKLDAQPLTETSPLSPAKTKQKPAPSQVPVVMLMDESLPGTPAMSPGNHILPGASSLSGTSSLLLEQDTTLHERNGTLAILDEPLPSTVLPESGRRLTAAMSKLLHDNPAPSEERDNLLLTACLKEATTAEDMEPYRHLLSKPGAAFQNLTPDKRIYNGHHPDYRFIEGRTFDEIQGMVERFRPLYGEIRNLAVTLPPDRRTMYRWGKQEWKENDLSLMKANGKISVDDLYRMRGFTFDQMAIYAADNPEISKNFGPVLQTMKLSGDTLYLDTTDAKVLARLETLFQKAGVYDEKTGYGRTGARTDLFCKAGIDVGVDIEDNLLLRLLDQNLQAGTSEKDQQKRLEKAAGKVSDQARSHFPGYYRIYNPAVIKGIE